MRRIIEYCLVSADGIVLDDPFRFRDYQDDAYLVAYSGRASTSRRANTRTCGGKGEWPKHFTRKWPFYYERAFRKLSAQTTW